MLNHLHVVGIFNCTIIHFNCYSKLHQKLSLFCIDQTKNIDNRCPRLIKDKKVEVPYTELQLKGMFKRFDTDGDGCLSLKELRKAFSSLGSSACLWRAIRALWHADSDRDERISEAELENLVTYALKHGYTIK
ncbi:hypothetical protein I3760_15G056600 [Carya illinoinensis]|uniref:EF-hand domain-containing protein n=1 Tax=Carya illinoinensis TaxID=32201 RepID=A0A922ABN0_CARIL|nr:hypothetical protein I3760_15G056600 [Carya illinoinensis]KAG6674700.1 hypothetical protein I3842_15G057300 [Carya illinoinensis]